MVDLPPIAEVSDVLIMRFYLQNIAAKLLPGERVSVCLRYRSPVKHRGLATGSFHQNTDVFYSDKIGRASYKNLIVCSRLWHCPVCASRISEQRRKELKSAAENSGFTTVMATFTLRHNKRDNLASMVKAITGSYRSLKSGTPWQTIKDEYSVIGDVRALEVTYGDNGWHVHIHALLFLSHALNTSQQASLENALKRRFLQVLGAYGYDASWQHGVWLTASNTDIVEYVAKFGRLPKLNTNGDTWSIYHELTKANQKRTRSKDGLTPWGLLLAYDAGDKQAAVLFLEYAHVFKGFHQLQWSRGMKNLLHIGDIPDDKIDDNPDANYLLSIDAETWKDIVDKRLRAYLLRSVETFKGDKAKIWSWIELNTR